MLHQDETPRQQDIHIPEADTFVLEIKHFLDAIRTGRNPITSDPKTYNPTNFSSGVRRWPAAITSINALT